MMPQAIVLVLSIDSFLAGAHDCTLKGLELLQYQKAMIQTAISVKIGLRLIVSVGQVGY
jgi:hypothetical protein